MKKFKQIFFLAMMVNLGFYSVSISAPLDEGRKAFDENNYESAMKAFSQGFREGDPASAYFMARMLDLGLGVKKDKSAAKKIYLSSAKKDYPRALNRVALMYYRGEEGTQQDYKRAVEYFQRSAEKGDKNAFFNLGKMYLKGEGVEKDVDKAMSYYKQAAAKDHILALNTLGSLYKLGAQNDQDKAVAKQYFARSAEYGNAVGLYETAIFILSDTKDKDRFIKAHVNFNLASAWQHPKAPDALQQLTSAMSLEDVNKAQAMARQFKALSAEVSE